MQCVLCACTWSIDINGLCNLNPGVEDIYPKDTQEVSVCVMSTGEQGTASMTP